MWRLGKISLYPKFHQTFAKILLWATVVSFLLIHCSSPEEQFLNQHFSENIDYQGNPPGHFSDLEKGLGANQCGTCHQTQFQAWKDSLHSRTTGNQVLWELSQMERFEAKACLKCHSPLPEMKDRILSLNGNFSSEIFPIGAEEQGLFCAGCHVRNHVRYGPEPRNDAPIASTTLNSNSPHNGFKIRKAFSDSMFCKNCHESPENGIRLAGKKRMETYSEWKESSFRNQSCQSCHMPGREHSWKGIHDKDFILSGLEFDFKKESNGKELTFQASLESKKIGHRFPSYLVPLVKIEIFGKTKSGSSKILLEDFLGWQVTTDLKEEVFDTRLKPGEKREWKISLSEQEARDLSKITYQAMVFPDEFYIRKWDSEFPNVSNTSKAKESFKRAEKAIEAKRNSSYILWGKSFQIEK